MELTVRTVSHTHLPKKLISLLLVLVFVFNLMPVAAFADSKYSDLDSAVAEAISRGVFNSATPYKTEVVETLNGMEKTLVITDLSSGSCIWNIAFAFQEAYASEMQNKSVSQFVNTPSLNKVKNNTAKAIDNNAVKSNTANPYGIAQYFYNNLSDSNKKDNVLTLFKTLAYANSFGDEDSWFKVHTYKEVGDGTDHFCLLNNTEDKDYSKSNFKKSFHVKVQRDIKTALQDYKLENLGDAAQLPTSFSYSFIECVNTATTIYNNTDCDANNKTFVALEWRYISEFTKSTGATDPKDCYAFANSLNQFLATCTSFPQLVNLFAVTGNLPTLADLMSPAYESVLESFSESAKTAIGYYKTITGSSYTGYGSVINHWAAKLGGTAKSVDDVYTFLNDCSFAPEIALYVQHINALNETVKKTDYSTNDISQMNKLLNAAKSDYSFIEAATDAAKTVLKNEYGYNGDAAKNYIAQLNHDIYQYNIRKNVADIITLIESTISADKLKAEYIDNYNTKYGYRFDLSDEEKISDETLENVLKQMEGYVETIANQKAQNKYVGSGNYTAYVNDQLAAAKYGASCADDFVSSAEWEIKRRGVEIDANNFYAFFTPMMSATDISASHYKTMIESGFKKLKDLKAAINESKETLGNEAAVKELFAVTKDYIDQSVTYDVQVEEFLNGLVVDSISQIETEIEFLLDLINTVDPTLLASGKFDLTNFAKLNFSGYFSSIDSLFNIMFVKQKDDAGKEKWVANGQYTNVISSEKLSKLTTDYTKLAAVNAKYDAFIEEYKPEKIQKIDLDDQYPERLTLPEDYSRHGDDEKFVVTEQELDNTITALDKFLTSNDFAKILDIADAKKGINNLKDYIFNLLGEELFSDEMVNKIMALVYPGITKLLEEEVLAKLTNIDLGDKGLGEKLSIELLINGKPFPYKTDKTTKLLVDLFNDMGINIYPSQLFKYFYNLGNIDLAALFYNMGTSWDRYLVDPDDKESGYEFDFIWGVDDKSSVEERYSAFCNALATVFSPLEDVIKLLLTADKKIQKTTVINGKVYPAYAVAYNLNLFDIFKLDYQGVLIDSLKVTIGPVDVYGKIWIPIMESLGFNTVDFEYNFAGINKDSELIDIVKALFDPVLTLVERVSDKPVDTIISILPGLAYNLTFDRFGELLNNLELDLTCNLQDVSLDYSYTSNWLITGAGNLIKDAVSFFTSLLEKLEVPVNLGDAIDLDDLLDCNTRDINDVLTFLLEKLGFVNLKIPIINVATLITSATVKTNYKTQRTDGASRYFFEADKADVLFAIFNWIVNNASNREFIDGLMATLNQKRLEDGKEPRTLDDIIYKVLGTMSNSDNALAAIVEIVNPRQKGYAFKDMAWYNVIQDTNIEGANPASIAYLNYATRWNKDKANYVAEHLEDVIKGILTLANFDDPDIIENTLVKLINGVFTNDNISSIMKALVKLGGVIDENLMEVLLSETTTTELKGIDLALWSTAFGYLYDNNPTTTSKGKGLDKLAYDEETNRWSYDGKALVDGDMPTFADILCYIIDGFEPLVGFLFTGQDIKLFADAITLKGYNVYDRSVAYLFETLGIEPISKEDFAKLKEETSAEKIEDAIINIGRTLSKDDFESLCKLNPTAGLNYIIRTLTNKIMSLVENDPVDNLLDILPKLVYFIESDGISTVVKNLLHPVLVLLDTVRPILGDVADLNKILSNLIVELIKDAADDAIADGETPLIAAEGAEGLVEKLNLDINDLSLENIIRMLDVVLSELMPGVKMAPVLSPAFRTFCYPDWVIDVEGSVAYGGSKTINTVALGAGDKDESKKSLDRADTITLLICAVLEVLQYGDNAKGIDEFLKNFDEDAEGLVAAITAVFNAPVTTMQTPDWTYTFKKAAEGGYEGYGDSFDYKKLNEEVDLSAYHTVNYLQYDTDWTAEVADYLDKNLDNIILELVKIVDPEANTVHDFLKGLDIYSENTIQTIADLIKGLLEKLIIKEEGKEDNTVLIDLVDEILDVDLASLLNDFDTSKFNFDTDAEEAFKDALKALLMRIEPLVEFMFLGQDITMFDASGIVENTNAGDAIITLHGAEGYAYGIIPLLEALGSEDIKSQTEFYDKKNIGTDDNPEYKIELKKDAAEGMIAEVLDKLCGVIDGFLDKPVNEAVNEALELLPNLIFFVNSDGLTAAVNNTLAALLGIVDTLTAIGGEQFKLENLLGISLDDLSFSSILNLVEKLTAEDDKDGIKIELDAPFGKKLETFYIGNIKCYVSANGEYALKMQYNLDEDGKPTPEDRKDMLTILFSFVLDVLVMNNGNTALAKKLDEILGTGGLFTEAIGLLGGFEPVYYKDALKADNEAYEKYLAKKAYFKAEGVDNTLDYLYGSDWDEADSKFIIANANAIINQILNINTKDGEDPKTLEDFISAEAIFENDDLNVLKIAVDMINEVLETIGKDYSQLMAFITKLVGCDFGEKLELTMPADITVSDGDTLAKALAEVIKPLNKLLGFLLLGEDYNYFYNYNGNSALITIQGSEGYTHGVRSLLEALNCSDNSLKELDDLAADAKNKVEALRKHINSDTTGEPVLAARDDLQMAEQAFVNALLACIGNRLDEVLADPVNEALDLLPGLVYFVNSDGIYETVYNLLAPIMTISDKLSADIDLDVSLYLEQAHIDMDFIIEQVEKGIGYGFKVPDELVSFLDTFYIGNDEGVGFGEADDGYNMIKGDLLTFAAGMLIELVEYNDNSSAIEKALGLKTGVIKAALSLLKPLDEEHRFESEMIEWKTYEKSTNDFLKYSNNWNEETAEYIANNIDEIVAEYLPTIAEYVAKLTADENAEKSTPVKKELKTLADALGINVYSASTLNIISGLKAKLAKQFGPELVGLAAELIDCDLDIDNIKEYSVSEIVSEDDFKEALKNELNEFAFVLEFLLMGRDITLFNNSGIINEENKDDVLLTINGNDGYSYGLAPILEALGFELKPLSDYVKDGSYDTKQFVSDIVDQLCGFIDEYVTAEINAENKPLEKLVELLPSIIYFVNSDGLTTCVNNLLQPLEYLVQGMTAILDEKQSINDILGDSFDLDRINFEQIFEMIEDSTSLNLDCIKPYILTFNTGYFDESFTSISDDNAKRMVCGDNFTAADVITTLLCLAGVAINDEANNGALSKFLGKDTYMTVKGFFNAQEFAMLPIRWQFTKLDDDGELVLDAEETPKYDSKKVYSVFDSTQMFSGEYGPMFTQEMAQYIADNFSGFVDTMLDLLGIQIGDTTTRSLKELLNQLIGTNIYTVENAKTVYDLIMQLNDTLNELPAAEHIKEILKESLGIDLAAYDELKSKEDTVLGFKDGEKDGFIDAIVMMVEPVYPVLEWLLCGKNISFFVDEKENDAITLLGAEGYAYGVIPILEAIMSDTDQIEKYVKTPKEYKDHISNDPSKLIYDILDPVFMRLDEILSDPADEILNIFPNVAYFMDSYGLDTCWKNIIHAVKGLTDILKPMLKDEKGNEFDLYQFVYDTLKLKNGADDLTFKSIKEMLVLYVFEQTGFSLELLDLDELNELTCGMLTHYTSQNGKVAMRMIHCDVQDGEQHVMSEAETVTTFMRLIVKFIGNGQNAEKIKAMIDENENIGDDAKKFYKGIIDMTFDYAQSDSGIDTMLYTMYQVFYGVDIGATETKEWLDDFNERFNTIYETLANDKDPAVQRAARIFADYMNGSDAGNIINENGLVPNGFISFFESFINIFSQLFAWIRQLFSSVFA